MGSREGGRYGKILAVPDDNGQYFKAIAAERGPVKLRYFAPPLHLRNYFGSLYHLTIDADHYADVTRADMPQLRFMMRGTGRYHFHDGAVMPTPDIGLLGPTMGATRFELDGPSRVIGISLLPAGWLSLTDDDASSLADRLHAAPSFQDLTNSLASIDEEDVDAVVDRCWATLSERVRPLRDTTWTLLQAIDAWLTGEGSPRIEALAETTGVSPRQLARLTNRYYGAPPKLLARKYRALRCSARLVLDQDSWQTLCEEGGFYDQSHFIREIKHFIGLTPHQLQTEPTAVAQLTLLRRSIGADIATLNRVS